MFKRQRRLALQLVAIAGALAATQQAHAFDTSRIAYHGGPVLSPEIVPLYWGWSHSGSTNQFSDAEISANQQYLTNLTAYMNGSLSPQGKQPTVAQYGVRNADLYAYGADPTPPPVGTYGSDACPTSKRGQACSGSCASQDDFMNEVQHAQNDLKVIPPYNPNRIVVVFVKGTTVTNIACDAAWHTFTRNANEYFAIVPIEAGQGATSHEIFEASTNPTWNDSSWNGTAPANGAVNEIADSCSSENVPGVGTVSDVADLLASTSSTLVCSTFTQEQVPQMSASAQTLSNGVIQSDIVALTPGNALEHLSGTSSSGWGTWQTIGGAFTTSLVTLPNGLGEGAGSLDVFGLGTDHHIYDAQWSGSSWAFKDLVGAGSGIPAAIRWSDNLSLRTDLFVRGTDGAYYHKGTGGSTFPASWDSIAGIFNGAPATAQLTTNLIEVFGRGTDGNYYYKTFNGSTFSTSWAAVAQGHPFISEPVATSTSTGLEVCGQGTDWAYYCVNQDTSGTWHTVQGVSGLYMGPPTIASETGSNIYYVFGQGTDSNYYGTSNSSGSFGSLQSLGKGGLGGVATSAPSAGTLNLFVEMTNNNVSENVLSGTIPGSWSSSLGGDLH